MEEEKKNTHGGKREGAGRPKGIKTPYKGISTKMPVEYVERLRILSKKDNISIGQILKDYVDKNWEE